MEISLVDEATTMHLEAADFVKLERNEDHGRIVVATREIDVGCKIIREKPVLVWQSDKWEEYLTKFTALSPAEQLGVLDMHCFPLGSQQLHQHKHEIFQCADNVGVNQSLALKLLSISLANGHDYYGRDDLVYEEVASFIPQSGRSNKCALFLYASKVSHSCHPNVTYTSKTKDGKMEYKAVRKIEPGDMICFPYTFNIWETPTHLRRKELQDARSFYCKCKRCMGPDLLRIIKCGGSCKGVAVCTYDSLGVPLWSCQDCNATSPTNYYEKMEEECNMVVNQTEMMMMTRGLSSILVDDVKTNMIDVEEMLHPLHFLSLKTTSQYAKLCASKAHDVDQQLQMVPPHSRGHFIRQFGKPEKVRSNAAKAAIKNVLAIECIAAQCLGCNHLAGYMIHETVYEASQTMFHCSQDLIECPPNLWPTNAKTMVRRYLPSMKIQFGESDPDVMNIQRKIIGAADSQVDISEVTQSFQTVNVSADKAPSAKRKGNKKTKKKKKRGRYT